MNLSHVPFIHRFYDLNSMYITNSNTCQFQEVVYVNLIDLVQNGGNEIVVDKALMGQGKKSYTCPNSIAQSLVAILK